MGDPTQDFRGRRRSLGTAGTARSCERRVIGKAEFLEKGANPRFVVTSLSPERLEVRKRLNLEDSYCGSWVTCHSDIAAEEGPRPVGFTSPYDTEGLADCTRCRPKRSRRRVPGSGILRRAACSCSVHLCRFWDLRNTDQKPDRSSVRTEPRFNAMLLIGPLHPSPCCLPASESTERWRISVGRRTRDPWESGRRLGPAATTSSKWSSGRGFLVSWNGPVGGLRRRVGTYFDRLERVPAFERPGTMDHSPRSSRQLSRSVDSRDSAGNGTAGAASHLPGWIWWGAYGRTSSPWWKSVLVALRAPWG